MRYKQLAVTLAACVGLCGCATPDSSNTPSAPTNGYVQIVEPVADGVHVMRQALPNFAGVVGNVTIIEQSNGLVLVDSGSSYGDGVRVVSAVRSISRKPVTAVILTHWHNDHPLGLPAILEAWPGASVIATEATLAHLANNETGVPTTLDDAWIAQRTERIRSYVETLSASANDPALSQQEREGWARALSALPIRESDVAGTHLILPTRTFVDRLLLDDRRTPIEVRFEGAANTDGDAEVWLPRQRVLIAGDAVVWPVPYNFSIDPDASIATLERLQALNYAALIPGHGEVQRDKHYVYLLIEFTRAVNAEVAALAPDSTVEEVTARLSTDAFAQRFAGDDPWLRYWFNRYARDPLIASAYAKARNETP